MFLSTWLRIWKRSLDRRWALHQTLRRKPVARRRTVRPRLEFLEDRCTPSAVSWTGDAGTLNWSDTSNWSNNAVPTKSDDVTINTTVNGTINIGTASYARSLNDTTASLAITSGGSLSLSAVAATSTFGQNVTVQSGGALTVGAGASVLIGPAANNYGTVALSDDGTLSFASGDTLTLNASTFSSTTEIAVGSGGLMTASGTTFNATAANNSNGSNSTLIDVQSSGELQASNSSFAIGQVNLAVGVIFNTNGNDLVGNAFDTPLYLPAIDVQYLSNNLRFQDIYLQPDTLTSGQSVALNAIGTQNKSNLVYILPGNFTINQGATLAVGAGVNVQIGPAASNYGTVTLTDDGTLSFASGDTLTLNATTYSSTTQIVVGSGGLMTASGTTFNATAANNSNGSNSTLIVVNASGELQASNSTFAIGQVNLAIGTIFNTNDLVGNAFDTPLYLPAIDVQYLSNNLRFQDIYLQPDTLTSGQSVALNAIGTQNKSNLVYILPGNFTINQGATLAVGAGVNVQIGPAASNYGTVTLTDDGTLSFASGDTLTLNATTYSSTTQIVVGSGGLMTASGATFNATAANNSNGSNSTLIVVNASGELQASNSTFAIGQVNLAIGTIFNTNDLVGNAFDTPLYLPAIDVQYLSNNLRFQDIYLQPDTLTSGQSVALNAIGTQNKSNLVYILPGNFTINQGATLAVGAGVNVQIGPAASNYGTVTLTDDGTLSFASGDTLTLNATTYSSTTQIVVGSGGLMTASGATFNATAANNSNGSNSTLIVVNASGELQASNSTFAIGQVNLAIGTIFNTNDLVGNAFDTPLYLPAIDVQYLSNNLRFQDIYLQPDTLTSGQSVALNAIGTQNKSNLVYILPGNFTINQGATLAVGAGVNVQIGPAASNYGTVTLTDDGTLSFASGDTLTLNATTYSSTTQIVVGSGGLMTASGATFNATAANNSNGGNSTQIVVASGGELQASNSTFSVGQVNLAVGVIFNTDDLVGNAFDTPLYLPAIDVQYLSNNLRFQDIYLQPDTLTSGQSVALNAIGTQNKTNLVYVLPGNFTINKGAALAVGAGVTVLIGSGSSLTLTDNGMLTFGSGDTVTLNDNGYSVTSQIVLGRGGLMTASGATFNATAANNSNGSNSTLIDVNAGQLQLSGGTFDLPNLSLDAESTDTIQLVRYLTQLTVNSGATVNISWNDFSNVGTNGIVASGNSSATINLDNNYWGTTDTTQIAAKIDDHSKDSSLPTVSYQPFLTAKPVQTVAAPASVTYNSAAQNVTLSAALTSPSGTVSEGTVTFTILNGKTVIGTPVQGTVSGGKASASYTLPAGQTAGTYTISVSYSDSAGNFTDVSDVNATLTITQSAQTSTTLSSSPNPADFANPVTFTATVTVPPPGTGTPTGTVAFLDGSTVLGSSALQVVKGVDEATFTTSSLSVGSHAITAVYSGDNNFPTSTSTVVNQVVLPVYVVTKTADDGSFGTLRYGINQANALGGGVSIDFNIGTVGSTQKINLLSQLALTDSSVYINGLSQGGSGNTMPLIILSGANAGANCDGLLLQGSNCSVSGLFIENFSTNGIEVDGSNNTIGGTTTGAGNILSGNAGDGILIDSGVTGTSVQGNYIGIDSTGNAGQGNSGNGIEVKDVNNSIGGTSTAARNIISANALDGILLDSGATGTTVQGNYIGTNAAGTGALGNGSNGIEIAASDNTLGGTTTGAGNLISGNGNDGILIDSGVTGTGLLGNYIGTNAAGSGALGNSGNGVEVAGNKNTIGGTTTAGRNFISGNSKDGMLIDSSGSGNVLLGNYIGTNVAGAAGLGNGSNGVELQGSGNTVGGTASGAGNVIAGNVNDGILIDSGVTATKVLGNWIGNAPGTTAIANSGNGVEVAGNSNTIGGTTSGSLNIISGNSKDGVLIDSSGSSNQVLGNRIGTGTGGGAAIANKGNGVEVAGKSNTIGGSTSGAGNLISSSSKDGLLIDSSGSGNLLLGNSIGTNAAGTGGLGNSSNGVELAGNSNTVGGTAPGAGNVIAGNVNDGILIDSGVTGTGVLGNSIGTNVAGTSALGNVNGVEVQGSNNTIGGTASGSRNLISGNSKDGVLIDSSGSGNQLLGSYIGTNAAGTGGLGNSSNGVEVAGNSNAIGGAATGAGNVIAGNVNDGVLIDSGATATSVLGNWIGNAPGTGAIANSGNGIEVAGNSNTIGGTASASVNIISGNSKDGVLIDSSGSGNQVLGNRIGTGAGGGAAVANKSNGVEVAGNSNTIGGTASGSRNLISGNSKDGVLIDSSSSGTLVQGNYIGLTPSAGALGNGSYGVSIAGNNNSLGGSASGAGNSIADNKSGGVLVSAGSGNTISENSIYANGPSNTGPGITISSSANNNLAAPSLSNVTLSGGTLSVTATFTPPVANVSYVLEFFANPTGDPEGKVFLGSKTVTPTSTGSQPFTFTTANTSSLSSNPVITATLTDSTGDTSAFSAGVVS